MSAVLALKLTLVPALIAGVTLAGRRWGPAVAGWLSAFPVVSAPILLFLALEHGAAFTASAAAGTLSAVLAILAFGLGYAHCAARLTSAVFLSAGLQSGTREIRHSWMFCLFAGFTGYFVAVACLSVWAPTLYVAAPCVLLALLIAPKLYPRLPVAAPAPAKTGTDMPWRMVAGAVLVLLVTHFSAALGARLSGLFAMFPVMGSVLVVFSHRRSGAAFTVNLLRGMVLGYYAFATFCLVLSMALLSMEIGTAFFMALACAVLVQLISRRYV
jgi:hypothetical protein